MSTMLPDDAPRNGRKQSVLVITSQVIRGGIGGRAAVFALERLGNSVWFLPTILLPWHPGHGLASRLVADEKAFERLVEDLVESPWLPELGAILTGYLGHASQGVQIAQLIQAVRKLNPDLTYICDPVMGDGTADRGALYVPQETAVSIRDHLVPLANMITPNAFELSWLSGILTDSEAACAEAARSLPVDEVMVTSAPALMRNSVATMLVNEKRAIVAEHRALPSVPHGTGDLMSALAVAWRLKGAKGEMLLQQAVAGTFDVAMESAAAGSDELLLSRAQDLLVSPRSRVTVRHMLEKRRG
ncbi:MAG: bifunctional hydroxymethylpyrimidine kinase/phosphomethylpyrimidine kinase [Stappiaceae bacterium]